jgi:hypothetical protein
MMTTQPPTPATKAVVCLLSEQPMPNLLSIHHFRPAQLVLVETEAMKRRGAANNFLNALRLGGLDYGLEDKHQIYTLGKHASFPDCADLFLKIVQDLPVKENDVVVNLTGGTKVMSIAAYEVFRLTGARLIYIDGATPDQFQQFPKGDLTPLEHRPTCAEFLRAYGFEAGSALETEFSGQPASLDAVARAFVTQAVAGRYPVDLKPGKDESDRNELRDRLRKGKATVNNDDLTVLPELVSPLRAFLRDTPSLNVSVDDHGHVTGRPDKFLGDFLTGGWLEVFVAGLLRKHDSNLGLWDVHRGLVMKPVAQKAPGGSQNELDIVFIRKHRLHVIECKSFMAHDPQFDALYKLDAVVHRFRALLTSIWFATTDLRVYANGKSAGPQSLDLDSPEPDLRLGLQQRLENLNCVLLSPHLLGNLARATSEEDELNFLRKVFK